MRVSGLRFKGLRVSGFKGSRVKGFKGLRVQGLKGSRVSGLMVQGAGARQAGHTRMALYRAAGPPALYAGLPRRPPVSRA